MNPRTFLILNKNRFVRLFLYVVFGVIGTAINVLIFFLLAEKLAVNYLVANLIAWIFSVTFAFVTNKAWVFESCSWSFDVCLKESIQFIFARIATCVFDMGYMFVAVSLLDWNKTVSKIIANAIVVIANYVLSKLWIFKKSK